MSTIQPYIKSHTDRCNMDLRAAKALEIAAKSRLIFEKGIWLVPSQSSSAVYKVSLSPDVCTCDDFQLRQQVCKHIIAAKLVQAREYGVKGPPLDTDVLAKRPTYMQNWPDWRRSAFCASVRFAILARGAARKLTRRWVAGQVYSAGST